MFILLSSDAKELWKMELFLFTDMKKIKNSGSWIVCKKSQRHCGQENIHLKVNYFIKLYTFLKEA